MQRKILIYNSQTENSISTKKLLSEKLIAKDFTIVSELDSDVELIVCIGGDGTLLRAFRNIKKTGFIIRKNDLVLRAEDPNISDIILVNSDNFYIIGKILLPKN